jgi:small-conductance mechanosensitive channel
VAAEKILQTSEWFQRAEVRIQKLTLLIGALTALTLILSVSWRWAAGIFSGALLAMLNFRWLEQAATAVSRIAQTQAGEGTPHVPIWTWIKLFARYGIIAVIVYTMRAFWGIPVISVLAGLCALGAAVIAESLYEVVGRPH